jgi:hypothetical protein
MLRDDSAHVTAPAHPLLPHPRSFLLTCYATEWAVDHVVLNSAIVAVLILAKLPEMHGVRLLGLNAARVD